MSKMNAREAIKTAAATHGWTPFRDDTAQLFTEYRRGTRHIIVQFDAFDRLVSASRGNPAKGNRIVGRDRVGQITKLMSQDRW